MSEEILYVRVKPYNKATGQLAQRVTIGDKLFVSGEWYQLKAASANKIRDLKQSSGANYFDVKTEEEFHETAREELAIAMRAAGLQGLAFQNVMQEPVVRPPKQKNKKSEFTDFSKDVADVDLSKEGVMRDNTVLSKDVARPPVEVEENDEIADIKKDQLGHYGRRRTGRTMRR
jgi:hypothetical protein